MSSASHIINGRLEELQTKHDFLLEKYNDEIVFLTKGDALQNLEQRGKLQEKIGSLQSLKSDLDLELISEDRALERLGERRTVEPRPGTTARMPRRPFSLADASEIERFLKKCEMEADPLSTEHRKRFDEILDDFYDDAVVFVESRMESFRKIVGDTGAKSDLGFAVKDQPALYTLGDSVAIRMVMAEIWAELRTGLKFQREQRLELEGRVTKLEARPVFEDAGIWSEDRCFKCGQGVTQAGSYWIAKRATTFGEKPGTSDAWRLAVKRGRDASDQRRTGA